MSTGKKTRKPAPARNAEARKAKGPALATVKVDAGLKKRWDSLSAIVERARHEGAMDWDALWEAVGAIVEHEPPLYELGGYKNAADYFQRALGENSRNASRYIRVARFASPSEEERYGVTKLDAGLSFIEAKLGSELHHPPLPIAFDKLRIPLADGRSVSFKDARIEDIAAATRALSRKPAAPTSSAERALTEAFAKHPSFKTVRVRVRNGLATIMGVPVAALDVFGSILHETKWPAVKTASAAASTRRARSK
jgi:hypothetical protein